MKCYAAHNNRGNTGKGWGKDPNREKKIRGINGGTMTLSKGKRVLRLNNSAANGITYQSGGFVDVEFFHDPGTVRFRSFYA